MTLFEVHVVWQKTVLTYKLLVLFLTCEPITWRPPCTCEPITWRPPCTVVIFHWVVWEIWTSIVIRLVKFFKDLLLRRFIDETLNCTPYLEPEIPRKEEVYNFPYTRLLYITRKGGSDNHSLELVTPSCCHLLKGTRLVLTTVDRFWAHHNSGAKNKVYQKIKNRFYDKWLAIQMQ